MFTRIPGQIRETDVDGENDPPVEPVVAQLPLETEDGLGLETEAGEPILL